MGNESSARIAERVIEAINDRNRDAIEELAHPEVQLRMPPARVFYGPDGVREFFDELEARMPDLTVTADSIHAGEESPWSSGRPPGPPPARTRTRRWARWCCSSATAGSGG